MLSILFEDNYLLAVNKPAGLQTERDRNGNPSVEDLVSGYFKTTYPWKKQLITGVVHRLDRQVSGVLVFAKTPMALKNLNRQFEERTIRKFYLAIVENTLHLQEGELVHWLRKDQANRIAVVSTGRNKQAHQCRLRYRILKTGGGKSLVEIELLTGRYHQIRAQFSAEGSPVLGDEKYGAAPGPVQGMICLHAGRLMIEHPKTGEKLELTAPVPSPENWPLSPADSMIQ